MLDVIRGNSFYIRKLFSGDVDGDGHDELILDVGGFVLVLKVPGNDQYEVFWAKRVSWADGIGVGDVNGNGTDDIVICKEILRLIPITANPMYTALTRNPLAYPPNSQPLQMLLPYSPTTRTRLTR
ncbi:MAG: VCBS repeat-containing protein [Calditrichae bacterium]|nr:VCBS repeat-containing protein [Calditrichia bacterium]